MVLKEEAEPSAKESDVATEAPEAADVGDQRAEEAMEVEDDQVEDVSEEAVAARHERSEVEERRKFMSYLKAPAGVRRADRAPRRADHHLLDSRAESSGANTPDQPLSPPVGGPAAPATPVGVEAAPLKDGLDAGGAVSAAADEEALPTGAKEEAVGGTVASASFTLSAIKERRRTASLTKKGELAVQRFLQDDNSATSWDFDEVVADALLFFVSFGVS